MDKIRILSLAFVVLGAVIGTCLHEFGHALAAYKGGDTSVKEKGYLTLNPLKYAHPLLSVGLPLLFLLMGGIPLPGGAVYIDHTRLRSRYWESLVALAGPAGTAAFTLALSVPFILGIAPEPEEAGPIWKLMAFLVWVEIAAFYMNLVPIPPLDGFRALSPLLPREIRHHAESLGSWGFIVLFLLFWRIKAANHALWTVVGVSASVLGIDSGLVRDSFDLLPFK